MEDDLVQLLVTQSQRVREMVKQIKKQFLVIVTIPTGSRSTVVQQRRKLKSKQFPDYKLEHVGSNVLRTYFLELFDSHFCTNLHVSIKTIFNATTYVQNFVENLLDNASIFCLFFFSP